MKKSLIAIAFAVATTVAFAQATPPAQNPPASGSTAGKSAKSTTAAKKAHKKSTTKKAHATSTATGGGASK